MAAPAIWLLGDCGQADFAAPLKWLNAQAQCGQVGGVAEARARAVDSRDSPDSILWLQSRPGQIRQRDVERLHGLIPLARLAVLTGPWCEGEQRTGRPTTGVERVPWHAWQTRLPLALGLNSQPSVRGPRTATESERLEQRTAALALHRHAGLKACIFAERRETYESLANALQSLGVLPIRGPAMAQGELAHLAIFDGWSQCNRANVASQSGVLLHFPRPEDCARASALGIRFVLALPLLLSDLATMLEAAAAGR